MLLEIDLRSLALMRIGVAATVLIDLLSRVRDLDALYGANGVLPPELARALWDWRVTLSLFTWIAPWPSLLWAAVGLLTLAAICLALGVLPRLSAASAWVLLAAIQDRNPALYMSGDRYLLLLLMWCALLPTGARFSFRPAPAGVTRLRSWAGAGLLLQIAMVYVLTGLKKTGPAWFDGSALWYALNQDQYVTAAGRWLRSQTTLIRVLSPLIRRFEIFGPLLAFSPVWNSTGRIVAVVTFWSLHLGLHTFQAIGVFQLVGIAAWFVFLPSALWDRVAPLARDGGHQPAGPRRIKSSRWTACLTAVPLAYLVIVMTWAGAGLVVRGTPHNPPPAVVERIASLLHLQEGWAMFASVSPNQSWYLAPGTLADGSEVELLRRSLVLDWSKPANVQRAQGGFRWTLYLGNAIRRGIDESAFRATYPALLNYFCRDWNARHGGTRRLTRVSILAVVESIGPPGSAANPPLGHYVFAAQGCVVGTP